MELSENTVTRDEARWLTDGFIGSLLSNDGTWEKLSERRHRLIVCAWYYAMCMKAPDQATRFGLLVAALEAERFADGQTPLSVLKHLRNNPYWKDHFLPTGNLVVRRLLGDPFGLPININCPGIRGTPQCDIFRDLADYRTLMFSVRLCGTAHAADAACPLCQRLRTPDVLAIAANAYERQVPHALCSRCNGTGTQIIARYVADEPMVAHYATGPIKPPEHTLDQRPCTYCNQVGYLARHHLDPVILGVLADALEDAGCTYERLLAYLRGKVIRLSFKPQLADVAEVRWHWATASVPRYRGFWPLDLVLGKE